MLKLIQGISILILAYIFILIYSFYPAEGFNTNKAFLLTEGSNLIQNIQQTEQNISNAIEALKFKTRDPNKLRQCSRFLKIQKDVPPGKYVKQLDLRLQVCNQIIDKQPEIFYITIITHTNNNNISQEIKELEWKIRQNSQLDIRIQAEGIDKAVLPQQLRDKINDENYINSIAQEFREMRFLRHCRFTYKKCRNLIIFLQQWDILSNGYYEVGDVFFSKPQNYKQTILSIVFGQVDSVQSWQRMVKIKNLQSILKDVRYINNIYNNHMIKPNMTYFREYVNEVNSYIKGIGPMPPQLVFESASTQIDFFPSEYKLGVYLPILLILIVFPCSNVLKM